MRWNSKTKIMTKLQNSNCDKTPKLKLWKKKKKSNFDKTQIVTKLNNSKCDKTQIVAKLKLWQNSNCDKTQKLKLWKNSETQIVTKLKTQNVTKHDVRQISMNEKKKNFWKVF